MYICGVLAFIISAHEARKMYAEHTQLEKIRPQASTQIKIFRFQKGS